MINLELYKLEKEDIKDASALIAECFMNDPLYCHLIPQKDLREKFLPEFFGYYLEMIFDYSTSYSDSKEMNGIITVFSSNSKFSRLPYLFSNLKYFIKTAKLFIKEDNTLQLLRNFIGLREFLNSNWGEKIERDNILHIDLFAVKPDKRGTGIGRILMNGILNYADNNHFITLLETHNYINVKMYRHFGFKIFENMASHYKLNQYCMLRLED